VRIGAVALAAALLVAGCGASRGGTEQATQPPPAPGTLGAILSQPGPDVALVAGTADFQPGPARFSFDVVRSDGRAVYTPTASVWVARSLDARPLVRATATLEPVGVPGTSKPALGGIVKIYVVHFRLPAIGKYWVVAQPVGGEPIQGMANLIVTAKSRTLQVGDQAIPSKTPTLMSTHGNLRALTTASPPDRELLRYSVADSLRAHVPFVVAFATPAFCTSRTCGPVVDVVDAVRKQFAGKGVRFIHVEIYEDNDPQKGENQWVREWRLPSEPWTFLVGRDGRIKARFEGSISPAELAAAVEHDLLG
jgi:hypothetical protein